MKNIWFMAILMIPWALQASEKDSAKTLTQVAKNGFGTILNTGMNTAQAIKKADGADVTVWSFPVYMSACGYRGFQKLKTHFDDVASCDVLGMQHLQNPNAARSVGRFLSKSIAGSTAAALATGFAWHINTDFTYAKWYEQHGKQNKK